MSRKIISSFVFLLLIVSVYFSSFQGVSAADITNSYFESNFSNYDSNIWEKSSWANGSVFNCVWSPSQVTFSNGNMVLGLDRAYGAEYPYQGGEYRTRSFFSYGYYEVRMKPAKNTGIVSSFFTYTGPSDNNPWDEIDIEFLGKDTTQVQFNWYKNGVGNNEHMYNLGFDASQSFHTYGFEWRQNYIDYYVDGKKVYRGTNNIPVTPGKIMMNLWPGIGVNEWLGAYDGKTPLKAEYEYVKYYPGGFPQSSPSPSPTPTPSPTSTPIPTPTATQDFGVKRGDVNSDGRVDSTDYAMHRRYLLGIITSFPTNNGLIAADVNQDGRINSTDYALIKRIILGIV
ncbi:MAG: family 16 glycosylhydrolase [Clostridiaceae bacterium]|nr:family 16 glycosylhydrolase [Clostridiaceae bacterium]